MTKMEYERVKILWFIFAVVSFILASCSMIELAGDTVVLGGKVARESVKLSGQVIQTSGKLGNAGIRYFSGSRVVKLEKEGNSYFVKVRINKKHTARLLLDTGATNVQISRSLAKKIDTNLSSAEAIDCSLADGSIVPAIPISLKEMRIGGVEAENVDALVLVNDYGKNGDGLLGMTFLNNFRFELDTDRDLLILKYAENPSSKR